MDNQMLIVAQVVLKGFIEANKKLPQTPKDWEEIKDAIYKTWLASEKAKSEINNLRK